MRKKKKSFPVKPVLLLGAAAMLLIGSTVGSTRAALTYYSENYTAQFNMSSIGVSLLENGTVVSHRDYENGTWNTDGSTSTLLEHMKGKTMSPGQPFEEKLTVQNTGDVTSFVRIKLTRSWFAKTDGGDAQPAKDDTLAPEMIELQLTPNSGWVDGTPDGVTNETKVYYYTTALEGGATSASLTDAIKIDNEVAKKVTMTKNDETGIIKYKYDYDGYTFNLEAEVDAVQASNGADAIKSAWGIDANVNGNSMSLQ